MQVLVRIQGEGVLKEFFYSKTNGENSISKACIAFDRSEWRAVHRMSGHTLDISDHCQPLCQLYWSQLILQKITLWLALKTIWMNWNSELYMYLIILLSYYSVSLGILFENNIFFFCWNLESPVFQFYMKSGEYEYSFSVNSNPGIPISIRSKKGNNRFYQKDMEWIIFPQQK